MRREEPDAGDPFDGLELDQYFVRAARIKEPAAAERVRRPALPAPTAPPLRRRGTGPRRTVLAAAGLGLLLVAALVVSRDGPRSSAAWTSGWTLSTVADGQERPTPRRASSSAPLGTPPPPPLPGGSHRFLSLQDDGTPVAYDPCRPVPFVVNRRMAFRGADALLQEALAAVEDATGLRFDYVGLSDEPPNPSRRSFQPQRYGDRWAPVLIAWTDPDELAELHGDVVGLGGSTRFAAAGEAAVYVTGMVALDGPQLARMLSARGGRATARSVILHELGHLVGLDHVDDSSQLMHGRGWRTDLRAGDRTGLARLGQGACVDRL